MFYSEQHNAVVYNVKDPGAFLRYVPGSGRLNNGYVFAPASLGTMQALRALGLPVIPLLDTTYDWPHGPHIRAPMASQKMRANFLASHKRCFDLSDPGTGKTLTALWAADALMLAAKEPLRAVVVAPLSALKDTWEQEIYGNFLGRRKCVVLHGSAEKRLRLLAEPADFYIINHDGVGVGARREHRTRGGFVFEGFAQALKARNDIKLAIVDEVGAYRDASTRRSRVARTLLSLREYVWLLTGTPTPNGPEDAHGLRKMLTPWWPETKTSWRSRTMVQVSEYKWMPRVGAVETVRDTLQPAVRVSLDECVELPPMVTQTREAALTPEQSKMLRELRRELLLTMQGNNTVSAVNAASLRIKFLQIVCGAVYDDLHNAHAVPCGPRIEVLKEIIDESNDKLIIFAPFTSVVTMLQAALKGYSVETVTGATSFKERSDIFGRFRTEQEPRIILADPGTMSHSLNLTIGKTVVWFGPKDNTEIYLQANRRIRRPGQDKVQRIIHIVAHRVERAIYERLANNSDLQDVVLQLLEEA